jgi:chloramphenicol-sensitive protein RarD
VTPPKHQETGSGLPFALGAYLLWGILPVYIKLLSGANAFEVLAHRILWSMPVVLVILLVRKQWGEYGNALTSWTSLRTMLLSSVLISANWGVYMWAIFGGHVMATSIGYYLNPLVNVLLGRIFLGERLTRFQGVAVAIAACGVSVLAFAALDTLWISLWLACSFGGYGLVRKMAPVGSVPGLGVEVTLLSPFALVAAIWFYGTPVGFGSSFSQSALMAAGGVITAIPLLLFATAARRMSYTSLGFVQYLAPTIVFFLGVFLFRETLNPAKLACFALIWTAIAVFSWDAITRLRQSPA